MDIAIIGTGVSGLVAAHLLAPDHRLTIFEADDRIGGHTHTVDVELGGRTWAVDTGFIVYNDWTYPNFIRLLDELGVESQPTEMSFSVRCPKTGLEYNGHSLDTLFAQRRNLLRPSFYRMIREILRFNREAKALVAKGGIPATVGDLIARQGYGRELVDHYLVPMGSAIWSSSAKTMAEFPAPLFLRFLENHGLLNVWNRPQWRVIRGGSKRYVEKLVAPFRDRIRTGCPVRRVERRPDGVDLVLDGGHRRSFDQVIFATHSDQALALLADADDTEREVLGAFAYQPNEAVLHTDTSVLPRRRKAWAAWNYRLGEDPGAPVAVTYDMNILQGLDAPETFCVTLNRDDGIDPERILKRIAYAHPVYTSAAEAAQRRHGEVNGRRRTYFCGAYWGNGFHEDGVVSALAVVRALDHGLERAPQLLEAVVA
ncbi:MAG: FAD-dependent oxidoreductase [Acidobacteria bacterium]|nr:FAD-dependent oxidoreductase [Acidobacteriota bacterium]